MIGYPHLSGARTSSFLQNCYSQIRGAHSSAPLTRDSVFKSLFHDETDPSKLVSFLNAVKNYDKSEEIHQIVFRDPCFPAYTSEEKNIIVDVVCESRDAQGNRPEIHVVEMQQVHVASHVKRWEFYGSRAFTTELIHRGRYADLKKVHVVAITKFPMSYPNDNYVLMGKKFGKAIDEVREVSLLSLSEVSPTLELHDSALAKWLHLIKYSGTELLNTEVLSADPVLCKAVAHLKQLKQNPPPPIQERKCAGTTWSLLNKKLRELPR